MKSVGNTERTRQYSLTYRHHVQSNAVHDHASSVIKKRQHEQWMNENSNEKSVHDWCKGPGTVWGNRLEANCSLYFSLSGLFWLSQLISARRHPASPLCLLLLRLAPGIPWGGALCLLICFHHTLPICSPHGLCLLSLLRERKEKSSNTLKELLIE